jgi:hypothetical protein
MFRAKQVFPLRRTSPPGEVPQFCGMTSNNNNEFQPPSMSDYVSLRAELNERGAIYVGTEDLQGKIERGGGSFKAQIKEDLRVLKSDVAEL